MSKKQVISNFGDKSVMLIIKVINERFIKTYACQWVEGYHGH